MEFSAANRAQCAAHGIDIEASYAKMLAEIRVGGALVERLNHEIGGMRRSNHFPYKATLASLGRPGAPARKRIPGMTQTLTPAEKRVLTALAAGGTMEKYANESWRSKHTIRDQVKSARAKLGARTSTHAVALAIRSGQIQPPAR